MNQDETIATPKYKIGQRVKVFSWGGFDFGKIVDIKWIYHNRFEEWTWGYKVKYENRGSGLTLRYAPEWYLRNPE